MAEDAWKDISMRKAFFSLIMMQNAQEQGNQQNNAEYEANLKSFFSKLTGSPARWSVYDPVAHLIPELQFDDGNFGSCVAQAFKR